MKRKTTRIHLVPNSHIDPVWLWDKYEGIDEVLNTFRSACNRMDEFPDLTFSASSLQFYEWAMQFDKKLFKRIRARIEEGRWEVCGGWWVEPDTNLPLESSFLKHADMSAKFAQTHLGGVEMKTAFLPDTFGHPATLPKILGQTGFKYFVFCRPGTHEKTDLPANLFHWERDGHRVLAYRLKNHYGQWGWVEPDKIREHFDDEEYRRQAVNCYFFCVGDHGGGPVIEEINFYKKIMAEHPAGDLAFSTCARFFEEAAKGDAIPTYSGDLHRHAIGCYSVQGDIKNAMRNSELALGQAERALQIAGKNTDVLEPAWKTTLFNQFHDILPGSCSPAAAANAKGEIDGVRAFCQDATYVALKSVSLKTRPQVREGEFRIFNTLPYPVTVPLAVESMVYYREGAAFRDNKGRLVEIQEILPSVRAGNRKWEFVDTIPAHEFMSYHFDNDTLVSRPARSDVHFQKCTRAKALSFLEKIQAEVNWLVLTDESDTWGHGRSRYDAVWGTFKMTSCGLMHGSVSDKLSQKLTYGKSTIDVVYSCYADLPGIYADVQVVWNEPRSILKLEINPSGARAPVVAMQCAAGSVNRPADGNELPLHQWLWVPTGDRGLAIVQKGATACDCLNGRVRLTLIRSSLYGFEDNREVFAIDPQHDTDIGPRSFRMQFIPDEGFNVSRLDQGVDRLNEPFSVIRES